MQTRPRRRANSPGTDTNTANVTSAVGLEETVGHKRARRNSLFTRTLLWVTGLVCMALLLATIAQAWSNSQLSVQLVAEQNRLQELQAQNQRLKEEAEQSKDPAVIEREAREKLGYAREGEQVVVMVGGEDEAQQQEHPLQKKPQEFGFWQTWWQTFFGG